MTKSRVRCLRVENWHGKKVLDVLFITYPEDNSGHDLISCLRCGHIYSVSVAKQVYVGPDLREKLASTYCLGCGAVLAETSAPYPDKYRSGDEIISFLRPAEIPSDEAFMVMEFDEIYSSP